MVLQERIFATTAVGAVVIGFALQDTLGNLFAGLAIQIEKPFRVGHWVRIADIDGQVSEVTWRATKVRTKAGNFVIVPNSTLAKDTITNYSEPTLESRIEVEVGVSYDAAPNVVKATILEAIRDEPLMMPSRQPEVLIVDFAASAITYRIRVWSTDFAADERLRDRIRSAVYYAFRRAAITIPYPIQVEIPGDAATSPVLDHESAQAVLQRVTIFAALEAPALAALARTARGATVRVRRSGRPPGSTRVVDVRHRSRRRSSRPGTRRAGSRAPRSGRVFRRNVAAHGRTTHGDRSNRRGFRLARNHRRRVPNVRAGEPGGSRSDWIGSGPTRGGTGATAGGWRDDRCPGVDGLADGENPEIPENLTGETRESGNQGMRNQNLNGRMMK